MHDNIEFDFSAYDFIDFGCKTGGSFDYCQRIIGAGRGLGVDKNEPHVQSFRSEGGDAVVGDVTALDFPSDCVRFVCISHMLEHLPSLDLVEKAVLEATRIAADFVYIVGPYFDADAYLKSLGLKFYWSDWKWHPTHVSTSDIATILLNSGIETFSSWGKERISSSTHSTILPISTEPNQHDYDPSIHPPKAQIEFDQDVYREMVFVVALRPYPEMIPLLRRLKVTGVVGPYSQIDWLFHTLRRGDTLLDRAD